MRANLFHQFAIIERAAQSSTAIIALGLLVLVAAVCSPTMPALTGMALVALGATGATLARFRGTPTLTPILLLHAAVYGGLYAMFVGATLHSIAQKDQAMGLATALDFTISIAPVALASALVAGVIFGQRSAS